MTLSAKFTQWNKFDRMIANAEPEAERIVDTVATQVLSLSDRFVPRDTGFLASSKYMEKKRRTLIEIGYRAFYAPFVNWGTRFMAPNPFFTLAFELTTPQWNEMVRNFFVRVVR